MVLPDQDANKPLPLFGLMHLLPDAVTRVLLTRWGRGIIGSEKTVRTVFVRGGHLRPDGACVKQLQQGVVLGHLVVPLATLDSELYTNSNDEVWCFNMFISVELLNL